MWVTVVCGHREMRVYVHLTLETSVAETLFVMIISLLSSAVNRPDASRLYAASESDLSAE